MGLRHWALCALLALSLAFGGMQLGVMLAGSHTEQTALGEVRSQARINFNDPGIDVFVPLANWGVRFQTWKFPVQVSLEPRSLDRSALRRLAKGNNDLLRAARFGVQRATLSAVQRSLIGAFIGALLGLCLAALIIQALRLPGSWEVILSGTVIVAAMLVSIGLYGPSSVNQKSLTEPDYYASGQELPQLLSIGEQLDGRINQISGQAEQTISALASLLSSGRTWANSSSSALQVSDLHNSTAALEVLRPLAGRGPIFWVGDFSIAGVAQETSMLEEVAHIGRPTVGVSGNHDSEALMLALSRAGMIVLTHKGTIKDGGSILGPPVIKINGLKVAGFEDPLAFKGPRYPGPRTRFSFEDYPDGKQRKLKAERIMWRWYQALTPKPDVLLIHQAGLAQALSKKIIARWPDHSLTILTGHSHKQSVQIFGKIVIVNDGTVGAGGILNVAPEAGLVRLRFNKQAGLQSADMISLQIKTGQANAQRVIISDPRCDNKLVFC